jgi:hypothetical protein
MEKKLEVLEPVPGDSIFDLYTILLDQFSEASTR